MRLLLLPCSFSLCNKLVYIYDRLVETHIFSFVVGRAFVTDIEKLKISSKTRSLNVVDILRFFSEVTQVGPMDPNLVYMASLYDFSHVKLQCCNAIFT